MATFNGVISLLSDYWVCAILRIKGRLSWLWCVTRNSPLTFLIVITNSLAFLPHRDTLNATFKLRSVLLGWVTGSYSCAMLRESYRLSRHDRILSATCRMNYGPL